MRILHVISGLGVGGAERNMARLVRHLSDRGHTGWVVSVSGLGPVAVELDGAPTLACDFPRHPLRGWRRARAFRDALNPDVIHGWMYHGNLLAERLARRPRRPLLWDVRHSIGRLADEKPTTRAVIRLSGSSLWRPDTVVFNSESGRRSHESLGYPRWPEVVIPNGVERPSADAIVDEVDPPRDTKGGPVVAWVARYHPMKDLETFTGAAARILARLPTSRFVFVGRGMSGDNAEVIGVLERHGLMECATLLGEQDDMAAHYPGFDLVMVSSRFGEGTPNVLLESMAAGVPCVSTDVGDAARVLGHAQRVAPPGDAGALARAALDVLELTPEARRVMIAADQRRVEANYSVDGWVEAYLDTYRKLLDNR